MHCQTFSQSPHTWGKSHHRSFCHICIYMAKTTDNQLAGPRNTYIIHHHHQSLNCKGHLGTTDDFATSFLHFPCSLLPSTSRISRTPGLSSPWCCVPTSSSVCLVFLPLSLCLTGWFWPDLMKGRHDHTTALYNGQVFVWSNCLLDLSTDFLVGNMVFVWDA